MDVAAPCQLVGGQLTLTSGVFVDGGSSVCRIWRPSTSALCARSARLLARLAHQGQGIGREMREAILHLAFAGLGAQEALSGAFEDNVSSLATSAPSVRGERRGQKSPPRWLGPDHPLPLGARPLEQRRRSNIRSSARGVPRHVLSPPG